MAGEVTPEGFLVLARGRRIRLETHVSVRARRLRLTLSAAGELRLTVPPGVSAAQTRDFLCHSIPWLERTLARQTLRPPRQERKPCCFPDRFVFPATGETLPIRYVWREVCWLGVKEENGCVLATGAVLDAEQVRAGLKQYLIRKAEEVFAPRLHSLAKEFGFQWEKLSVRFQRGRWGSCSNRRHISLNAQMLFLPPEALRYVMIHELCHIREMNHSPRFWREVEKYCPDYIRIRAAIRREMPDPGW